MHSPVPKRDLWTLPSRLPILSPNVVRTTRLSSVHGGFPPGDCPLKPRADRQRDSTVEGAAGHGGCVARRQRPSVEAQDRGGRVGGRARERERWTVGDRRDRRSATAKLSGDGTRAAPRLRGASRLNLTRVACDRDGSGPVEVASLITSEQPRSRLRAPLPGRSRIVALRCSSASGLYSVGARGAERDYGNCSRELLIIGGQNLLL